MHSALQVLILWLSRYLQLWYHIDHSAHLVCFCFLTLGILSFFMFIFDPSYVFEAFDVRFSPAFLFGVLRGVWCQLSGCIGWMSLSSSCTCRADLTLFDGSQRQESSKATITAIVNRSSRGTPRLHGFVCTWLTCKSHSRVSGERKEPCSMPRNPQAPGSVHFTINIKENGNYK